MNPLICYGNYPGEGFSSPPRVNDMKHAVMVRRRKGKPGRAVNLLIEGLSIAPAAPEDFGG